MLTTTERKKSRKTERKKTTFFWGSENTHLRLLIVVQAEGWIACVCCRAGAEQLEGGKRGGGVAAPREGCMWPIDYVIVALSVLFGFLLIKTLMSFFCDS